MHKGPSHKKPGISTAHVSPTTALFVDRIARNCLFSQLAETAPERLKCSAYCVVAPNILTVGSYLLLVLIVLGQLAHSNELIEPADIQLVQNDAANSASQILKRPLAAVGDAVDYVDEAQELASERFSNFMGQVDGFFSDAENVDGLESNRSWARIRLDANKPGGEDIDVGPSFKLRVDLPQTERRFKLLISTEDDDNEVAGENVERVQAPGRNDDQNASLAIRFIRTARDTGGLSYDLGVRQRDSEVQYFSRVKATFKGQMTSEWFARIANNYFYFSKSGFENRLALDFRRTLFDSDDLFFRSNTEFNWRKRQKGSIIGQTLGFYTQFGRSKSLALEALAGYHTSLNTGVSDRFRGHEIRIRWRHNVWRPWFFYEIWPVVSWTSNNDYEKAYGGLLRLEVVIGQQ